MKFLVALRKFREAKDDIDQSSAGYVDLVGRMKALQARYKCVFMMAITYIYTCSACNICVIHPNIYVIYPAAPSYVDAYIKN